MEAFLMIVGLLLIFGFVWWLVMRRPEKPRYPLFDVNEHTWKSSESVKFIAAYMTCPCGCHVTLSGEGFSGSCSNCGRAFVLENITSEGVMIIRKTPL